MRYAELISLYFERSNALQNYWTLYVVVIGGLLAVSSLRRDPDVVAGVLVSILFLAFAYKNLDAIHDVTLNRFATLDAIHNYHALSAPMDVQAELLASGKGIEQTLLPPSYEPVRNFHIACDLGTVLTIWAMQWRRWKRMA